MMTEITENDCIILYDKEGANDQVIAGGIKQSLEGRFLKISLPQMEALPGSNVGNNLNVAVANAGKKTCYVSRIKRCVVCKPHSLQK